MREILFRGKRPNGKWNQGDLTQFCIDEEVTSKISFHELKATPYGMRVFTYTNEVIPETVGQYTGLTDKNGTKIFEGDIVTQPVRETRKHSPCLVEFKDGKFQAHYISEKRFFDRYYDLNSYTKIIGNIHDNPELLESEVEGE